MSETKNNHEITLKQLILSIQRWIKYLLSKWHILLIATLVGGAMGFYYSKVKKTIYTATTTFVLDAGEQGNGVGAYAGMAALVGIDLGGKGDGIFQGDNLMELYKSRKMIEAALLTTSGTDTSKLLIDNFLQLNSKEANKKVPSPFVNFKNQTKDTRRVRDSILKKAVNDINVNNLRVGKLDKKLSIFKVDVMSVDENFSKEFNETLVKVVNDFYVNTKTKKSLDNIDILQYKTDSVRRVMNGSISLAASIVDATPNLNPTRQAQRLIPRERSQYSAETNKVILSQLVQNLEMSKMALMKEKPLIQVVDEPIFPLNKTMIGPGKGIFLGGVISLIFVSLGIVCLRIIKNILS